MAQKKIRINNGVKSMPAYEHGSAARNLAAEPAYVPERRTYEEEERRIEKKRRESRARRNNRLTFMYTMILVVATTAIFTICYQYLNMQSNVKNNAEELKRLQSELNTMKLENDAYEDKIEASVDYDNLYKIAVEELGMQYPKRSQIVSYDSQISEYVKQFGDIPAAE
ncbi:MAG: hypothetical protein ACI4E1_06820 [Lachnospira sp.]